MAYAAISKPSLHFNTKLYTGNGGTQSITGVGFQPDWTWIKRRDGGTAHHQLFDALRGATKRIYSSSTAAQDTGSDTLTAFDSDGFSVGANAGVNGNGNNLVSWNWKANGQGSSNTDGSTNTTYTSVNSTAGFSISTYAGSGSAATIGHGLGAAPEVIIIKCTTHTENWVMYHKSLNASGAGTYVYFNTAAPGGSGSNTSIFNNTAPTNSVFTVNTDGVSNGSGKSYVAYCFKEKKGFSKFGIYTGNGNDDGSFIYTGFKPAFVITKQTNGGNHWHIHDNKRNPFNVVNTQLKVDSNAVDETPAGGENSRDFLSNGFKFRDSDHNNSNGSTYIYLAFAEEPLVANVGSSIPATAR